MSVGRLVGRWELNRNFARKREEVRFGGCVVVVVAAATAAAAQAKFPASLLRDPFSPFPPLPFPSRTRPPCYGTFFHSRGCLCQLPLEYRLDGWDWGSHSRAGCWLAVKGLFLFFSTGGDSPPSLRVVSASRVWLGRYSTERSTRATDLMDTVRGKQDTIEFKRDLICGGGEGGVGSEEVCCDGD